jgi:hypothetical protein
LKQQSDAMLGAIPADLQVAFGAAVRPAIFVTTHVACSIPVHASIVSFKVVLMRSGAVLPLPTPTILVAVVNHRDSLRLLSLHLRKYWYWSNGTE